MGKFNYLSALFLFSENISLFKTKKNQRNNSTYTTWYFLEHITTTNIIAGRIVFLPSTVCNNVVDYILHMCIIYNTVYY